jgi:hypothetical protein
MPPDGDPAASVGEGWMEVLQAASFSDRGGSDPAVPFTIRRGDEEWAIADQALGPRMTGRR